MKRGGKNNDVWPTPDWLYLPLHQRFGYQLDAAASWANAKCARYYDEKTDGLRQPWDARAVYCNPPYGGRGGLPGTDLWVHKGRREAERHRNVVSLLIPVKPDTLWWDELVMGRNRIVRSWRATLGPKQVRGLLLDEGHMLVEVLELVGRVSFGGGNGWFASAVVTFGVRA